MIRGEDVGAAWKAVPWNDVFTGGVVGDRIFLRSALIRKEVLPLYAGAWMPETFVVGDAAAAAAAEAGRAEAALNGAGGLRWPALPRWVVKPADSSNAYGVRFCGAGSLAATVEEARAEDAAARRRASAAHETVGVWVAQRCVDSFRLGGHKFHVRVLLLLAGDLEAFVFDDARVLVAPATEGRHADVTNRSFNQAHPAYDEARHNLSLRSCAALDSGLDEPKERWPRGGVLRQARNALAALAAKLASAGGQGRRAPEEEEEEEEERKGQGEGEGDPAATAGAQGGGTRRKRHFFALPNTWELFGVDFMLDADRSLVRPRPSLSALQRPDFDAGPPRSQPGAQHGHVGTVKGRNTPLQVPYPRRCGLPSPPLLSSPEMRDGVF